MPRDNLIRILAENAWRLNGPDPRSGAADMVAILEKEMGPIPVAPSAETAPQQVDALLRQVEDLKADKATMQSRIDELNTANGNLAAEIAAHTDHIEQLVKERETLTRERDDARDAGRQALEQLKGSKAAAATAATATLEAVVPTEQPPAPDQAAA